MRKDEENKEEKEEGEEELKDEKKERKCVCGETVHVCDKTENVIALEGFW